MKTLLLLAALSSIPLAAFADSYYNGPWDGATARANSQGGGAIFGDTYDLQLVDDWMASADNTQLMTYSSFMLGFNETDVAHEGIFRLFSLDGGRPSETADVEAHVVLTVEDIGIDETTGLYAHKFTANIADLGIIMNAGDHKYMGLQPVSENDWYYQMMREGAGEKSPLDSALRDGPNGSPGYGSYAWLTHSEMMGSPADASFEIGTQSVPEPGTLSLLVACAIPFLRRKKS